MGLRAGRTALCAATAELATTLPIPIYNSVKPSNDYKLQRITEQELQLKTRLENKDEDGCDQPLCGKYYFKTFLSQIF